jgi:thiamine-phosphate pyrophosphorylase
MTKLDYRLNALVDSALGDANELAAMAATAARNGATLIQYRDKTASTRTMIERAAAIRQALLGTSIPLVINDRVDVALAAQADGVHLGRTDMDATLARKLLGDDAIIGVTVKDEHDADVANRAPIDYACIGGVFQTLSKINPDPPLGIDGFRRLRVQIRKQRPQLPVGAIAGIILQRIPAIVNAGADGVAVISAAFHAPDVAEAIRALRRAVDHALEHRLS